MANTYLQRTFSTPTNRKIFTVSLWVKRNKLSSAQCLFGSGTGTNSDGFGLIDFQSDDSIRLTETPDYATTSYNVPTNRKFRDTSAWYHIVWSLDTTQATESDRIKLYVNGVQETSFNSANYPSLNLDTKITLNNSHMIGRRVNSSSDYFDGLISHYHFIDGTAYDADTFGETDATTGIWKPKTAPSVTYGTNGFFLKFENSGAFGTDSSGNSNTFTVNGTMTQTIDTPSNVFATLNPLDVNPASAGDTFSNGNTTLATDNSSNAAGSRTTLAVSSGKYYCEVKYVSNTAWNGVMATDTAITGGVTTGTITWYQGSTLYLGASNTATWGTALSAGDIQGIALDMDNNRVTVSQNGQWWNGSSFSASAPTTFQNLTSGYDTWSFLCRSGSGTSTSSWNFGNGYFGTTAVSSAQNPDDGIGIFEYAVPTGYKALCTKSINAQEYD